MQEELFDVIDEKGNVIGRERRSVVHKKGLWHKAVEVFVLDERGRIFIQRRSFHKQVCPGLWDLSTAEHLKPGETFIEAAARGVAEELGAETVRLQKIGEAGAHFKQGNIIDNEKKEVYKCGFKGKMKLQKEELEQGKWMTKECLLSELARKPKKFTPWLLQNKKFVKLL